MAHLDTAEPVTGPPSVAAETRHKILAAAATSIAQLGLARVRMATIAREAGVSTALLHYHFDTKELLFGEVLTYSHAVSAELNQRAMDRAGESPAVSTTTRGSDKEASRNNSSASSQMTLK